ncbi:MAG: hypothetical protein Q8N74_07355 [Sulfuricella sp.]|nr:hypothetical protein [Sulfuricella sp.]
MNATTTHDDDDMPAEVDFTGATRGKFYRPNLRLNLPVYLDADVQNYLNAIAAKKGMPLSQLANDLLKREIGIIEAVK